MTNQLDGMRAHCSSLGISIYGAKAPRALRSEHPLWLCNYLFQVLNDLANNLLLLPHSGTLFRLFSGLVITLKVPCIKRDECCEGLFISRNKLVTWDIKVCLGEQFATL